MAGKIKEVTERLANKDKCYKALLEQQENNFKMFVQMHNFKMFRNSGNAVPGKKKSKIKDGTNEECKSITNEEINKLLDKHFYANDDNSH